MHSAFTRYFRSAILSGMGNIYVSAQNRWIFLLTSKVIFKMMTADKDKFKEKLLGHLNQYLCDIQGSDGNWTVKGFIDIFYHFLEGIVIYPKWKDMIEYRSKHKRIKHNKPVWCDKNKIYTAFNNLFKYVLSNNNSEECLLLGLDG